MCNYEDNSLMQKNVMKNILIKKVTIICAAMLIALLPHSATAANTSEALVKDEKHDDVKSMLLIAAQNGDAKAQLLYIQRNIQSKIQASKPITDQAKAWAENGNVSLMVWLADNYYTGNQLPQEYKNAATWYIKAAQKGDLSAQYNLGYMHIHGQGIKQDLMKARDLLTLAANKNHQLSINLLKKVNAEISELKAKWKAIKEEQRQAQLEYDKALQAVKIAKAKQNVQIEKDKLEIINKKLVIAKIKLKEANLVNALLAERKKFKAGTAFKLIKNAPLRTDKIKIIEYFSYNCGGCHLLQKNGNLEKWVNAQSSDIEVNKIHITGMSKRLARLFYTLEKMGADKTVHKGIFNKVSLKQSIYTKENGFLDFISSYNVDKNTFNNIYSSPEMDKKIKTNAENEKKLSFRTIPAFVINGQYYVTLDTALASKPSIPSDISQDERNRQIELRALEIIDYLISIERDVIKNK